MDNKTVFVVTLRGEGEIRNHTRHLREELKRALMLVDDTSTVEELTRRAAPSLRANLADMLQELADGWFIQDKTKMSHVPRMAVPKLSPKDAEVAELDFTGIVQPSSPEMKRAEIGKKGEHEATQPEQRGIDTVRIKVEHEAAAARAQLEAAQARLEAEIKARAKAEARAKHEAEAARLKAENEAAAAGAQLEAAQARLETEAKARAKAEARAKQEAEAVRLKAEQEAAAARAQLEAAQARLEAEVKARAEAEARAKQEAEAARLKAEHEAAAAMAQLEAAQARLKAEAKARAEAEARVKQEAEAARIKAEQEAAAARVQLEAAQARLEAEAKARAEAEARVKQEALGTRFKVKQKTAEARVQLEAAQARLEAEAEARVEAEARAKQEAEAARFKAEQDAAEARAQLEAAQARLEVEARGRVEAEARAKQEAEAARFKAEKDAAEARAQLEAAQARLEAEARGRVEAEARTKQEAEAARFKAEQEAAEARVQLEAVQARLEVETKAKAESTAKAETKTRVEAEARAKQEAAGLCSETESILLGAEREKAEAEIKFEATPVNSETNAKPAAEVAQGAVEDKAAHVHSIINMETAKQPDLVAGIEMRKSNNETPTSSRIKSAASSARSLVATVLFLDIASYTKWAVSKQIELKKQFNILISGFLRDIEESQRLIVDTGDGAAIGFLQHPEQAIEVALLFRQALTDSKNQDYPDLRVRMGINLGPVNILMDMNGQSNMLGDGINDAQRIMSFAKPDHIYISRSYYDVVSRLSGEYVKWLVYRGVEKDKHGRQYQVYEVTKGWEEDAEQHNSLPSSSIQLGPFTLSGGNRVLAKPGAELQSSEALNHETGKEEASDIDMAKDIQHELNVGEIAINLEQKPISETAETKLPEQEKPLEIFPIRSAAELEVDREQLEENMRKMADEQVKVWTEAEQRARELAAAQGLAKAEQVVKQPEPQSKVQHGSRMPRKQLPLIKIFFGLFVFLLLMAVLLPYVWPMTGFIGRIEEKLSAQLQQPVHITELKASMIPLPKLELTGVSVGNSNELKASSVVLKFGFSALYSRVRPLTSVELNNLEISEDSFVKTLPWLQAIGGDMQYPVARMELHNAHMSVSGLTLPSLGGDVSFDGHGHFLAVNLDSQDKKLGITLQPQETRGQIVINLTDSSLPLFPDIKFDELNLKGNLGEKEIVFSEIDGRLYGGDVSGNAKLNWRNGWQLLGHATVNKLELRDALPILDIDGQLGGEGNFKFSSATLKQLAGVLNMDGNFNVKKGVINRLDLLEASRLTDSQNVSGGRTYFDDLNGMIQVERNNLSFHQLRFSSEVMGGSGAINVDPDGHMTGQLNVELKVRPESASLVVSGTPEEPRLNPAH
ncbi:MAG: adenylate/guanylate cyclase domain-containing protein [Gallionellaceae bacterium]